jgi:hypothetical protein
MIFVFARVELRLEPGHVAELRRAHRREVFRVREKHRPRVADPLVETNGAICGLGFEIRSDIAELKSHRTSPLVASRITPRRRTVWGEPTQTPAVLSEERVEAVDERSQSTRAEHRSKPSGQPDLGQEDDPPARLAGNGQPAGADDPPAFGTSVLRHRGEQAAGFLVRKWQQGELLVPVE